MRRRIGSWYTQGIPIILLTLLVVRAVPLLGQSGGAASSSVENIDRISKATVIIKLERMYRGEKIPTQGTGFFIDPAGILVTNWHVVAPQVEVNLDGVRMETSTATGDLSVVLGSGTREERSVRGKVLSLDRVRDLALVRVAEGSPAWLEVGEQSVRLADPIWVAGFPFGDLLARNSKNPEITLTSGRVTSVRHDQSGAEDAIQVDAAVNPGNSGGPLLGADGRVVGVISAGISRASLTSFAIPIEKLQRFLQNSQVRLKVEPSAVYSRATPFDVIVSPLLLPLTGLRCELVLVGGDIPPQSVVLESRGSECRGAIRVPERLPDASGVSTEYRLTLRLRHSDGSLAVERDYPLAVKEQQTGQLRSDRQPTDMMRDRYAYANRTEVNTVPIGLDDRTSKQTQANKKAALAELAKHVNLKKDADGRVILQNEQLSFCRFDLKPENYQKLALEKTRSLAMAWDQKECEHLVLTSKLQNVSASTPGSSSESYRRDQERKVGASKVQSLQGELGDLHLRIKEAGICRCESGEWEQTKSATCNPCIVVRAPS